LFEVYREGHSGANTFNDCSSHQLNYGDYNGFDDRAIHDAAQIIVYFNYINRIVDGLGIDEEDITRPWEDPDLFEHR